MMAASSAIMVLGGSASAANYSAVNDFSITNGNPNGVWSYISELTAGDPTSVALLPNTTTSGQLEFWTRGSLPTEANVLRNMGPSSGPFYGSLYIPPDHLDIDPEGEAYVAVAFTAPVSGSYDFSGDFLGVDQAETAHTVNVLVNGVTVFTGAIAAFQQSNPFSGSATLAAGQSIEFVSNTGADYRDEGTGLAATITSAAGVVPEPETWALMFLGFSGMGAVVRRRRATVAQT
jgi:hypothetical protein